MPAKPTLVLFVRHGTTPTTGKVLPGRARGLHLSERGREQAQRAAERIAELGKIAAVYSSPLERARETAAPIARLTKNTTRIERGLIECDFGAWTGQSLRRLMKKPEWSQVQRSPSTFRFPAGESFVEMQTRMVSAVDAIRRRHPGRTVVCVSHADTIKQRSRMRRVRRSISSNESSSPPARSRRSCTQTAGRSCSPSTPPARRCANCGRHDGVSRLRAG